MTRLKIEVVGEDDAAALHILKRLRLSMIDSNESGELVIQCPSYTVSDTIGNAIADVEREARKGAE